MAMKTSISFRLNGRAVRLTVDGDRMLLWVLRTELGLTGTKYACGEGFCGACTVLVDGEAVQPQPGNFYGGWITNDIVGPFKGEPGTMGW